MRSLHSTSYTQACLTQPSPQIRKIALSGGQLLVVQDDLLHPVLGGNKLRKLDALIPEVKASGCTDLVSRQPHAIIHNLAVVFAHMTGVA